MYIVVFFHLEIIRRVFSLYMLQALIEVCNDIINIYNTVDSELNTSMGKLESALSTLREEDAQVSFLYTVFHITVL